MPINVKTETDNHFITHSDAGYLILISDPQVLVSN
jgi:hypothetical protein